MTNLSAFHKFKILSAQETKLTPTKKPGLLWRLYLRFKGTPWVQMYWMKFQIVVENYDQLNFGDILAIPIVELSAPFQVTEWCVMKKCGKYFVAGLYPETAGLIQITTSKPCLVPVLPERKLSMDYGYIIGSAHMKDQSSLEKMAILLK